MRTHLRVGLQKFGDSGGLVRREIVRNHKQVGQKGDELLGGMAFGPLAKHFAGVERGYRDSVPWRAYSKLSRSAHLGDKGSTGTLPSKVWIAAGLQFSRPRMSRVKDPRGGALPGI